MEYNNKQHINANKTEAAASSSIGKNAMPIEDNRNIVQKKPNKTGMPDNLKSGIENLSGHDMSDVRVHYNSPKPQQLSAHAYAQGTNIHIASGQEKHLPHEAWHIAQQKQGRVKPTMQMQGGVNVNDDKALEKEADVMGGKALQMKSNTPAEKSLKIAPKSNTTISFKKNIVQLTKTSKEKKSYTPKTKIKIFKPPTVAEINPLVEGEMYNLNMTYNKILEYIKKVKSQLEDDEDIKLINKIEKTSFDFWKEAIDNYEKLKKNPRVERTRSSNKNKGTSTLEISIINLKIDLNKEFKTLKHYFPVNSGGFGAKGRAHDIETEFQPKTDFKRDTNFTENISLNRNKIKNNVYKKSLTNTKESTGPLLVNGIAYYPNNDKTSVVLPMLGEVNTSQTANFTNTPAGKDRGYGQYKNMGNTNAAGYAWASGIPLGGQRWEWLHIRGAGLGGNTDSSNLVTGTRDANTHMIPFESNIRTLGTLVGKSNIYDNLWVKWSVSGEKSSHAFSNIKIEWQLNHKDDPNKMTDENDLIATEGEANFKPLYTASNISKKEVEKLETALKEVRDTL